MRRFIRLVMVAGLVLALLPACSDLQTRERVQKINDAATSYAVAIRWDQYDAAEALRASRDKGARVPARRSQLDIRVTGFHVERIRFDTGETTATVTTQFDYYVEDSGTVHTLHDVQQWWYDDDAGRWFLDGKYPDFAGGLGRHNAY